eukprot:4551400-Amphidinium_carterae.1
MQDTRTRHAIPKLPRNGQRNGLDVGLPPLVLAREEGAKHTRKLGRLTPKNSVRTAAKVTVARQPNAPMALDEDDACIPRPARKPTPQWLEEALLEELL